MGLGVIFRVLGFGVLGFWVLGLGCWVLGLGFWVLGFGRPWAVLRGAIRWLS